MLVGRAEHCARIARLLDGARGQRSGVLVLIGEPGIGKTALCAGAAARADGMRVLRVQPVEPEADLPFAGLSELCADELDRVERLPEPQARTLEAALARRDARPGDRFAIGAAVLSLLGAIAEEEPALVIVDDAHWLDGSSADALLFAARRLRREPVALLIATRPGGQFGAQGGPLPCLQL